MTRIDQAIVELVLSAVPAALAYVTGAGEVPYRNERMAALPAALRDQALAAARERGVGYRELVSSDGGEERIWRFDFHAAGGEDADALVVVGTDITATRRMEGEIEELLAFEQSARAMSEHQRVQLAEEKVQLEQVASTDPLTGLLNRRAFDETIERELAAAAAAGHTVGLLYLDLDKFKPINDTLGHAAGDDLLVEVGHRLRASIRGEDVAARLGGDEFALLLTQLPVDGASAVAHRVAERALEALCDPVYLAGGERRIGASIGVAIGAPGALDPAAIIAAADAAMYEIKRAGGGRHGSQDLAHAG